MAAEFFGQRMHELTRAARFSSRPNLTLSPHAYKQDGDMAGDTFPECPSAPRHVKAFLESQRYLDSTPTLNLASFVTTMVEPECTELMVDALRVNQVDAEEYLSTTQVG